MPDKRPVRKFNYLKVIASHKNATILTNFQRPALQPDQQKMALLPPPPVRYFATPTKIGLILKQIIWKSTM